MVLIWKDARSFKRHLEEMMAFRQSHAACPAAGTCTLQDVLRMAKNALRPVVSPPPNDATPGRKVVTIPLWTIKMRPGCQN